MFEPIDDKLHQTIGDLSKMHGAQVKVQLSSELMQSFDDNVDNSNFADQIQELGTQQDKALETELYEDDEEDDETEN